MDMSSSLERLGIVVAGEIPLNLVENVEKDIESGAIKQRHIRQTELEWTPNCEVVKNYFEVVS